MNEMNTKKPTLPPRNQIEMNLYRRDRRKGPAARVGMLIARRCGNRIAYGWSRCNTAEHDKFSFKAGVDAALKNLDKPLPLSFQNRAEDIKRFRVRVAQYFSNDLVIPVIPMTESLVGR